MTASAYPPSTWNPVKRPDSHRFSWPRRQYGQSPSVEYSHGTPTRSPSRKSLSQVRLRPPRPQSGGLESGQLRQLEIAFDDVKVGPAHAAAAHAQANLAGARLGKGHVAQVSGFCSAGRRLIEHHGAHARSVTNWRFAIGDLRWGNIEPQRTPRMRRAVGIRVEVRSDGAGAAGKVGVLRLGCALRLRSGQAPPAHPRSG